MQEAPGAPQGTSGLNLAHHILLVIRRLAQEVDPRQDVAQIRRLALAPIDQFTGECRVQLVVAPFAARTRRGNTGIL